MILNYGKWRFIIDVKLWEDAKNKWGFYRRLWGEVSYMVFFQTVSAGVGFNLGLSCDLPGKGSNEQSMTFIRFRCYLKARA